MNITTPLTPRDFKGADDFQIGHLRHITAALDGAPCIVIVGGDAWLDARIGAIRPYRPGQLDAVTINNIDVAVQNIRMVIPLTTGVARAALRAAHIERLAAIARAKSDRPDAEDLDGGRGIWTATTLHDRVDVKYTPRVDPGARRPATYRAQVSLADIAASA